MKVLTAGYRRTQNQPFSMSAMLRLRPTWCCAAICREGAMAPDLCTAANECAVTGTFYSITLSARATSSAGTSKPKRFSGLEVYLQFKTCRLLHGLLGWLSPFEDFVDLWKRSG